MTNPPPEEFWRWSLENYPQPGVEEQLLDLQDNFGVDVNIALWCCWCATKFEEIPAASFQLALEEVSAWNAEIVTEIRKVRRRLKHLEAIDEALADLRDQIKKAELQAEKYEQTLLDNVAHKTLSPANENGAVKSRALRNLSAYAALIEASKRNKVKKAALDALIARIFPQTQSHQTGDTTHKAVQSNNV